MQSSEAFAAIALATLGVALGCNTFKTLQTRCDL